MDFISITFVALSFFVGPHNVTVFVASDYVKDKNGYYVDFSDMDVTNNFKGKAFTYPTVRVVDEVWKQATCKLSPQPFDPGDKKSVQKSSEAIFQSISKNCKDLTLVAGHKKDVVMPVRKLKTAIYGWHKSNGKPIQPRSEVHDGWYSDYSQGFRPMLTTVIINGSTRPYTDLYLLEQ